MALFGIVWPLYGHGTFVEEKLQVSALGWGSSGRRFKSCRPDGERSRRFIKFGIVPTLVFQVDPFLSNQRILFTIITYF